ncbi:hypothetical protein PRIPAC_85299, partial [Pristionchus pacificus]
SLLRSLTMRALLFVTSFFASAAAITEQACPPDYLFFEEKCIRPFTIMADDYLVDLLPIVRDKCALDGAHLPMIKSHEENESYNRLTDLLTAPKGKMVRLVLDLVCDDNNELLTWSDGTDVEYKPLGSDNMSYNCSNSPSTVISAPLDHRWERVALNDKWLYTSLCVYDSQEQTTTEQPSTTEETTIDPAFEKCGYYDLMENTANGDQYCLKVHSEPLSWEDAQKKCSEDSGSLLTINSIEENNFFWSTAVSNNIHGGMHIGARQYQTNPSKWMWTNGEMPISCRAYNNFIESFPIPGVGECASMATESSLALWVNQDCNEAKLPFICQKGDFAAARNVCPKQVPSAGEAFYSPGYPDSDISCEYFLFVEANKRVEIEIQSLTADVYNDYLEILEGSSGSNILANLTGTIHAPTRFKTAKSNVLRVNWISNGEGIGRGFKIRYSEVGQEASITTARPITTTSSVASHGICGLIVALLFCLPK